MCQDLDFQTLSILSAPKFGAEHRREERINYLSSTFKTLLKSKILLTMQSSMLNIGGPRKFQLLELQGSAPMDDGTPLKIRIDLINVHFSIVIF